MNINFAPDCEQSVEEVSTDCWKLLNLLMNVPATWSHCSMTVLGLLWKHSVPIQCFWATTVICQLFRTHLILFTAHYLIKTNTWKADLLTCYNQNEKYGDEYCELWWYLKITEVWITGSHVVRVFSAAVKNIHQKSGGCRIGGRKYSSPRCRVSFQSEQRWSEAKWSKPPFCSFKNLKNRSMERPGLM